LIVALQAILLFVLLHESAISNGVYVGGKLELFGWLLCSVSRATRLTGWVSVIETWGHEASVAILNGLLGRIFLTLR